ncbi:BTB/POZ domain protein [Rhizoctonia solani AG-3 Rhs1AP]|uniref:BTB/POZ domain protein n=1 Tax=Rhizoctonia solani AG-3 Rhs1AP TaxID=1086054 RepID=X8IYA4_9AGAM|nr:BTB/POZ domain protein [Rhizoctonia solani AG-3 Rhs1AP]
MSGTTSTSIKDSSSNGRDKVSTTESHIIVNHDEFFFNDALVAIQIEDTLFNIHKYQLLKSEIFSDMFKVPKAKDDKPEEGSSPNNPIKMEGVKASDFAALLKVLYAGQFCTQQLAPTATLVVPAFRLANMWGFSDLRSCLLPLAEKALGDVDKVLLARELGMEGWLAPAHIRLCQRREQLTGEEARKLGMDSVLLIARMREQNASKDRRRFSAGHYCSNCSGFSGNGNSGLSAHFSTACKGCQSVSSGLLYYNGGGNIMSGTWNNTLLEAEVKKWVRNGCIFKD